MPPDHQHPLAVAAALKREQALQRTRTALQELHASGEQVSFQMVARRARVSRQWLYSRPDLRSEIERLRERMPGSLVPAREQASTASLRQRLETLLEENRRLRAEITDLKGELAIAYGLRRAHH
jgi:Family of unknown function (DUF6262)